MLKLGQEWYRGIRRPPADQYSARGVHAHACVRRGAIDATEFAKRAEARREQRRIELDAVDKTRDADLAALRRSFRKRDEAAGDAVSSDSSSDSSSAESSDDE